MVEDAFVSDSNPDTPLVYGSATVIHVIDKRSKGFDNLSPPGGKVTKQVHTEEQHLQAAEESRTMRSLLFDYRHFASRVTLRKIHPNMVNVALLGRVVKMRKNVQESPCSLPIVTFLS
jgi:hypothetical protein